jgi:hypothetical protein
LETPQLKGRAKQLKFWIRGLNAGEASSLQVEGFDGASWIEIATLKNLPGQGAIKVYNSGTTPALDTNFIKFRFTYTKKGGTVILDDVSVNYDIDTPDFVPGYRNLSIEKNSKTVNGLDAATTYYYRVRAETGDNASSNSNVVIATTKPSPGLISAGINDLSSRHTSCDGLTFNMQAFPNPSASEFALTVQTCKNEKLRVLVTDVYGKKVYQATGTGNNKYIFGKNFTNGVYFVTVNSITVNRTIRIIKGN